MNRVKYTTSFGVLLLLSQHGRVLLAQKRGASSFNDHYKEHSVVFIKQLFQNWDICLTFILDAELANDAKLKIKVFGPYLKSNGWHSECFGRNLSFQDMIGDNVMSKKIDIQFSSLRFRCFSVQGFLFSENISSLKNNY